MSEEKEVMRKKYKGMFNWYGQLFEMYTRAESIDQAFMFFCNQLSEIVKTRFYNVRHYFYDSNKYEISEMKDVEKKKKVV